VTSIPTSRKFAISSWVNDQFETASLRELGHGPRDVDDHPHGKSDPNSGVTGEVYLAERVVYYHAPDTPPRPGWWNMGRLPSNLRERTWQPVRDPHSPAQSSDSKTLRRQAHVQSHIVA
jgi:hypothetical protein